MSILLFLILVALVAPVLARSVGFLHILYMRRRLNAGKLKPPRMPIWPPVEID